MNPKEVKSKWPEAYAFAKSYLIKNNNPVRTVKKILSEFDLNHEESKRVVTAVSKNISLEDHQKNIFDEVEAIERKDLA